MKLNANAIFEAELARRGLAFVRDGADEYRIQIGSIEVVTTLANVRRNAERDDDPGAIKRLVDHVLQVSVATPNWTTASKRLLLSAERADQEFGDTVREVVTDEVVSVLTLTDDAHTKVVWITPQMCADWGVTTTQATVVARENQDRLLAGIQLELAQAVDGKLGMIPLDSPYKASVIFARTFKNFVQESLGWPVLVVIPCRDFIYIVDERSPLLNNMGPVVVKEFLNSGYAITTEVLRISDDGIDAIGHFPTEPRGRSG